MTTFNSLGLSDKVLSAVSRAGYTTPTPIQAQAIPHVLTGRDVLGIAQTGTGKTASFTLPMLTLLERGRARARMPRTLILEPTRELAAQVAENLETYGKEHNYTIALLIGGVSFDEQDRKLTRGADIVIATPGRLLDHFERGKLLLSGIQILVVDEADRMLDMGFIPDIERIFKLTPFTRQTLFFSATMPDEIQRIVSTFLSNPVKVEVARQATTAETVTQQLLRSAGAPHAKRELLRRAIRSFDDVKTSIIFCNRKRDVATLERSLKRHGFNAGALHGDMDQHARTATLAAFRTGDISILVASDVAARGLDIPDVGHVFNYDVPTHSEDYVHRIGRTGRAGRSGVAVTIATPADAKYLDAIEKLIGKPIPLSEIAGAPEPAHLHDDADEAEERPARNNRRKDRKPRQEARDEAPAPKQPAEKPQVTREVQQDVEERRSLRQDKNRRGRRGDQDDADTRPFGETEYVPDFLLRGLR